MPKFVYTEDGGFEKAAPGNYIAKIEKATLELPNKPNRSEFIKLILAPIGTKARVKDYLSFSPNAAWKISQFVTAFGLSGLEPDKEFDLEPEMLQKRYVPCRIEIVEKVLDGKSVEVNEVRYYITDGSLGTFTDGVYDGAEDDDDIEDATFTDEKLNAGDAEDTLPF